MFLQLCPIWPSLKKESLGVSINSGKVKCTRKHSKIYNLLRLLTFMCLNFIHQFFSPCLCVELNSDSNQGEVGFTKEISRDNIDGGKNRRKMESGIRTHCSDSFLEHIFWNQSLSLISPVIYQLWVLPNVVTFLSISFLLQFKDCNSDCIRKILRL